MLSLTAHRLECTLEALTPVELNEHQGAAIRGALFCALRERFCAQKHLASCAECMLVAACPVATLVSTFNPQAERGRDVPRPYVIEPPLDGRTCLAPGESLTFGLTLFARALELFPYAILALTALEEVGLGKLVRENGRRRGRARLVKAVATNPLTGARQAVLETREPLVRMPDIPVTDAQVLAAAPQLPSGPLALEFLTPTRLVAGGRLCKAPEFGPLFHRLSQRLADLEREFGQAGGGAGDPEAAAAQREAMYRLVGLARDVRLAEDCTRWVELESYSTRQRRTTPIGGLVGRAIYEGDLAQFLPWLVWGHVVHVGKDAVKGNGWYVIREA